MVHPIPTSSFIQLNDFCTCNSIVCHVFIVTVVDKCLYACISAQEALGVQAFTPTAHKIFMIVPGELQELLQQTGMLGTFIINIVFKACSAGVLSVYMNIPWGTECTVNVIVTRWLLETRWLCRTLSSCDWYVQVMFKACL